jgi:hypothetical protein
MAMMDSGWIIAPTMLLRQSEGKEGRKYAPQDLDAVPHTTDLKQLGGGERLWQARQR